MEREIGEKFTSEGDVLRVVEYDSDDTAYFERGNVACNRRCIFCFHGNCTGDLSVTGDCQKRYRRDNRHVYFENAALARSPLGAAAANSAEFLVDSSKILHLHLKKEWYNMIECGEKREEYRNVTEYWRKRFANKNYTHILFYYGYTKTRMLVPIRYIKEGIGRADWGAPVGKPVYIFGLGEIIDENRWKILRDV